MHKYQTSQLHIFHFFSASIWPVVAGPSRALVVLYRMLTIFACYVLTFMFGMLFLFLATSHRMFLSTDFAFRTTDWTCCHGPHLHAILRIISRGVSGLVTDSPCGVWGRGWTTCLLHDSPFFGSHFKMKVGLLVWNDISYIYYYLPLFTVSCMKPVIFLLCINLFIYQVLCTFIYRRRSLYSFLITILAIHTACYEHWFP